MTCSRNGSRPTGPGCARSPTRRSARPSEADDAVQEAWLRLSRSDADSIENLGGWLTTVVARVCLNMLQARREEPQGCACPSRPPATRTASTPKRQALLADSIGPALLVILHTLTPAERLAFVLHDMFAVPFDDIAPIVGRSPAAARQLASRARRRVQGAAPVLDTDQAREREIVDAFLTAARNGDFEALLKVLDPDVVVRSNGTDVGPRCGAGRRTRARLLAIRPGHAPRTDQRSGRRRQRRGGEADRAHGVHDHRRENRRDRPHRRSRPHRRGRPGDHRPRTLTSGALVGGGSMVIALPFWISGQR